MDEQTMHQRVASRLVHKAEIEVYLGGMVIETIHAGEPLRRNAVVTADNPAAVRRLSLALTDLDMITAVIPVSSGGGNAAIIPDNVSAGDYVNVTMGLAGSSHPAVPGDQLHRRLASAAQICYAFVGRGNRRVDWSAGHPASRGYLPRHYAIYVGRMK
ncbi:MAG: hypothetical protein JXA14_14235 [Anaerolineae bacterium]|nr:hypothetical protein [Anaerolineae bacterium]